MKRSPIRKVSKRRRSENKIYRELSETYLEQHPVCECCGERQATQIHHKARRGIYLLVIKYFMAVCSVCHHFIETHPEAARKAGWLLDKFNPENI
jgi:hypothetical protein